MIDSECDMDTQTLREDFKVPLTFQEFCMAEGWPTNTTGAILAYRKYYEEFAE